MYGSTATPSFTPETAPQILATALYFNDISLASDASAFMVRTIKYGGVSSHLLVVPYLEFATRGFYSHYSDEIIDAAFTHLCQAGTTSDNAVIESVYLKLRDVKWIEKVLKSDCFFVATKNNGCSSEEERWRFIREVVRRRIQAAKIRLVELERQAAAIVGQWHGSRTHSRSASTLKSQNLGTLTSSSTAATTASEAVLKSPIEQMTPPRSPPPPFSSTSSSTAKVLLPPIKSSSIVSKISPSLSSSCESSSSTVSSSSLAAEAEMVEQEILDIHTEIEQLAQILNTSIKFENLPFGRLASIKHKMERSTRTTTKTTSSSFTDHSASSAVTPLSSMLHLGGIHSEQDQSSLQSIITNMATQLDSITLLLATRPIVESFLDEVTLFKSNWSAQELESRIHMTDTAAAILVPPARVRHNEHSRGRRRPPPPPPSMPTSTSSSPPMSRSSSISSAVSTLDSVHSSSSTFTEFSNTDDCDFNYDYDNDKNDNDDDNYGNEIQDDDYPNIDTDQIDSTTLSSHFASILMNDCDSTIALPYGKKGSLNYFRFSFEFRNVGEMESDKISSGPVYYAG